MFIQGSKMMLDRCVVSYECLWTHLRLSWKLSGVSLVTFWKRIPMVSKIMLIFCLTQWSGKLVRLSSTVHYILQKGYSLDNEMVLSTITFSSCWVLLLHNLQMNYLMEICVSFVWQVVIWFLKMNNF